MQGATKKTSTPFVFPIETVCPGPSRAGLRCNTDRRRRKKRVYSRVIIFLPDKEPLPGWPPSGPLLLLSESLQSQTERRAGDVTTWAGTMRCCELVCIPASRLAEWAAAGRGVVERHAHVFVIGLCLCLSRRARVLARSSFNSSVSCS